LNSPTRTLPLLIIILLSFVISNRSALAVDQTRHDTLTNVDASATDDIDIQRSGATTASRSTNFNVSTQVSGNGIYTLAVNARGNTSFGSRMETPGSPPFVDTMNSGMSSIIPAGFNKALGAYDPGLALSTLPTLAYDHYFVSWDMSAQWIRGVNQHQALLEGLASSRARNRQPMVTLEPWSAAGLSASNLLSDVVAGKYDANIQWACADLGTYGGTVLVRWGHEMENLTGRYPWATNGTSAYISAYRYFVDKCRAVAPNTRYVWSPTGNRNLGGYWPGPSYTDYVGLSVFNHPNWEVSYYGYNRSFQENFGERYSYVAGYGKPVIIAEFGATGATQVQWLSEALAEMRNFPQLQAANFFDAKDPANWGALPAPDWRVDPAILSPPN
jgi:beta-mannanase